jgi:choice-of-anchor C domain-containing protein
MKRSLIGPLVVALAWIAAPSTVFAATSITNGSFEAGSYVRPAPWNTFFAGSSSVTGWTIDSGSIDATFSSYWPASDGEVSIDLNGDNTGSISQAIATTVGTEYRVTYDLSGNPACGPSAKTLTVSATGSAPDPETFDIAAAGSSFADMKWSSRSYTFTATATTTTITFASTTPNTSCGPALDNVAIGETAPPPPPPPSTPTTAADCRDGGWTALADADGHPFKNQGDCVSYVATDGRNVASTATPRHPSGASTSAHVAGAVEAAAGKHAGTQAKASRRSTEEPADARATHHDSSRK